MHSLGTPVTNRQLEPIALAQQCPSLSEFKFQFEHKILSPSCSRATVRPSWSDVGRHWRA